MELWSRDLKRCEQRIDVPFNRFVIFNTNDFSFHGHPDKLNVPAYRSRRSIATYYYSEFPPDKKDIFIRNSHSTLYRKTKCKRCTDKRCKAFTSEITQIL